MTIKEFQSIDETHSQFLIGENHIIHLQLAQFRTQIRKIIVHLDNKRMVHPLVNSFASLPVFLAIHFLGLGLLKQTKLKTLALMSLRHRNTSQEWSRGRRSQMLAFRYC